MPLRAGVAHILGQTAERPAGSGWAPGRGNGAHVHAASSAVVSARGTCRSSRRRASCTGAAQRSGNGVKDASVTRTRTRSHERPLVRAGRTRPACASQGHLGPSSRAYPAALALQLTCRPTASRVAFAPAAVTLNRFACGSGPRWLSADGFWRESVRLFHPGSRRRTPRRIWRACVSQRACVGCRPADVALGQRTTSGAAARRYCRCRSRDGMHCVQRGASALFVRARAHAAACCAMLLSGEPPARLRDGRRQQSVGASRQQPRRSCARTWRISRRCCTLLCCMPGHGGGTAAAAP
jgi:hypothetical protein